MRTIIPFRAAMAAVLAVVMTGLTAPFAAAQGKMNLDAQSQKNIEAQAQQSGSTAPQKNDPVLRVCADPSSLPQSNDRGEGYENKIAEALAHDLGKKVEYTFFPQRMGFVRNTLRARDEQSLKFKCDLIIGVPKGYDLTATTQPVHALDVRAGVYRQACGFPQVSRGPRICWRLPPEKLRTAAHRHLRPFTRGRLAVAEQSDRSRSDVCAAERRSEGDPQHHHRVMI